MLDVYGEIIGSFPPGPGEGYGEVMKATLQADLGLSWNGLWGTFMYLLENPGSEKLGDFPKVTQPINSRSRIRPQVLALPTLGSA